MTNSSTFLAQIACGSKSTYIQSTMHCLRCFFAGLLLLVLGGAGPVLSAQGSEMGQPVVAASVEQSMPNNDKDCGVGGMAIMTQVCSSIGTCIAGVLAPFGPAVQPQANISSMYTAERISGFSGSPDPFPPKFYVLA